MKSYITVSGAALMLACVAPASASVTVGDLPGNSGNCYPFACTYTGSYQQIYGANAFSGVTLFDTLTFYVEKQFEGSVNQGTYNISFYYSSNSVDGLSTDGSGNLGSAIGNFGIFTLTGQFVDSTLVFSGVNLQYDPSLGNLLMNVDAITTVGGDTSFDGVFAIDETARQYSAFGLNGTDSLGLITTFSNEQTNAVPEPATWATMLLGFGLIGGAMRARRRTKVNFRLA